MAHSIFNDIIGPLMRGPSSSHTAASWRIARFCIFALNEPLAKAVVEFDKDGSWATNYEEQGTVMGINGGLLELDITDPIMKNTKFELKNKGIDVKYLISSFENDHPNSILITLYGKHENQIKVLAASLGGGAFEIQKINDLKISFKGDSFALLSKQDETYWFSTSLTKPSTSAAEIIIPPILPIIPISTPPKHFDGVEDCINHCKDGNITLGDAGLDYEESISGIPVIDLQSKMQDLIDLIHHSIDIGLKGTSYDDRILPAQAPLIRKAEKNGSIAGNSIINRIIENVTAIMDSKSAMEVFVANPTAGSSGTIGGVLRAFSEEMETSEADLIKAYFAAGICGIYFAKGPGFSAEEHGCQVECGAASAMAAAGLVQLMGGNTDQAFGAASMALQNMLGLICDPVADRVEVPCLGKNVSAAVNAYSSAIMIMSGFDKVIPYQEVIDSVINVSKQMPSCVKCTGLGGLSITETSRKLKVN